ncbi:MAG TPA: hypothetical protein VFU98_03400 [Microlunatus sp.]|nr:hypothetical protein [Microlunatus sp.]
MITVLGWRSLAAPAMIVIFRVLAALWRQRGRRDSIERLVEKTQLEKTVRIVDVDRDGAAIHIVVERSPK